MTKAIFGVVIVLFAAYAYAQNSGAIIGRYQIASGSSNSAWRVDTATGDVVFCNVNSEPTCYRVHPK